MKTLYFDFECYDPDLMQKGSGYPFGTLEIISMGYKVDDGEVKYTTCQRTMRGLLKSCDTWVAHNISYELGCCKVLGVDFKDKTLYCTRIASILDNNERLSDSLDNLAKEILNEDKDQSRLGRWLLDNKIPIDGKVLEYPKDGAKTTAEQRIKQATNLCMKNLNIINEYNPELIGEYCKSDVELTYKLFKYFKPRVPDDVFKMYSNLNKVTVEMRVKGVRIDIEKATRLQTQYEIDIAKEQEIINSFLPGLNINSNKQLRQYFDSENVMYETNKKTGNGKFGKDFIGKIDHPLAKHISKMKTLKKYKGDFIDKLISMSHNGRIHGEMSPLAAKKTGRFAHTKPNLGNQPKSKEIRELFIADEGAEWFSLDFSSQEIRILVHYAGLCDKAKVKFKKEVWCNTAGGFVQEEDFSIFNGEGVQELITEYAKNPEFDSHTFSKELIAKNTGIHLERGAVKTIVFGKIYGRGVDATGVAMDLSKAEANKLIKAYDRGNPFVKEMDSFCKYKIKENGYVKTILGRKLRIDNQAYKALNKVVQGSAADQVAKALMILYDKYNIVPNIVVHDELNFIGTYEEAVIIKQVMETCLALNVPSVAEIGRGSNWGQAK